MGSNFNTSLHWCDNLLFSELVDIFGGRTVRQGRDNILRSNYSHFEIQVNLFALL